MNDFTRRSAIGVLGISPALAASGAAADAVGVALDTPSGDRKFAFGVSNHVENGRKIVNALRAMADDIDAGNMVVNGYDVRSYATQEEFLKHVMTIDFAMAVEIKA